MNRPFSVALTACSALLLTLAPTQTAAQSNDSDPTEFRVRWRTFLSHPAIPGGFVVDDVSGDLVALHDSYLVLEKRGQPTRVPVNRVVRVQRRIGTKPASAPAMVIGSAAGFALGFVGAISLGALDGTSDLSRMDQGLTGGVLVGAPLGAFVAYLASRSRGIYETLEIDNLRAHLTPAVDGSVHLGVQLSH